ncbi:transposase [Wenzhouxiangella sp. XN201]|uniref:transposase n=1 Tax=Wenzhouxiangella sp. XN201 TaxID=2710755 RepID=UPI0013CCA2B1|nr:transposase [Wenzhouxiangella sp. XN201]NEZ04919.1 transposase [Wenzhouxiangella sp. XN201]
MLTPSDHPFLYLRYLLLILFLGGFFIFVVSAEEDVVWWFWFVPIVPLVILFLVDRAELRCPHCRERWTLRVKGRIRLGESTVYQCRHCREDFDPEVDVEPVSGQGSYPPARGGERTIMFFLIGMAGLLLIEQTLSDDSPGLFGLVPLFMAGIAIARLKGWVKKGGGVGGGGGP